VTATLPDFMLWLDKSRSWKIIRLHFAGCSLFVHQVGRRVDW
jgi:hypothetical protein